MADDQTTSFKVGVILPLSGANAFGDGVRKGCEMAQERATGDRTLLRPIQVFFEDDRYDPTQTVTALRRLLAAHNIDALITISTGPTRAILPIIHSQKIPLLGIATNDGFTSVSPYAFSLWIPPAVEAGAMVNEATRRGYHRLARVSTEVAVMAELDRSFDRIASGKFDLVLDQKFAPGQTDFRSTLARLKGIPHVDGIIVNLLPAEAGSFVKQARSLSMHQNLFGFEVFESPEAIRLSEGGLEGQWYVTVANPQSEFTEEFHKRFPDAMLIGAANCHDAIQLISTALRTNKDREAVTHYLSSVQNFSGALGKLTANADRGFSIPAAIRVVRGNGYEQLRVFPGINTSSANQY